MSFQDRRDKSFQVFWPDKIVMTFLQKKKLFLKRKKKRKKSYLQDEVQATSRYFQQVEPTCLPIARTSFVALKARFGAWPCTQWVRPCWPWAPHWWSFWPQLHVRLVSLDQKTGQGTPAKNWKKCFRVFSVKSGKYVLILEKTSECEHIVFKRFQNPVKNSSWSNGKKCKENNLLTMEMEL